jgi:simple sugar transport system permease protein
MLAYTLYRLFQPSLDRPVLLLVIVLGGFLGGGLLGLLSGWMKARFNVDIIISTVLLNYIVTTMLQFLLYDHKYWMGASTYYPRTDYVTEDAWYPILTQDARLHMGFLIAVGLAILIYWMLKRTPYGYDIRALGSNPVATAFQGINVGRMVIVTMFISGGLAGLAGAGEVFGVHHNVSTEISPGYGYTGIIVAMVAELNPLAVIPTAILFGGLINGSVILVTTTGTHTSIIFVIQAFVLLSVLISRVLMKYRIRRVPHVE